MYLIPADTEKPIDKRKLPRKRGKGEFAPLLLEIDSKIQRRNTLRLLTAGENKRLRDAFLYMEDIASKKSK